LIKQIAKSTIRSEYYMVVIFTKIDLVNLKLFVKFFERLMECLIV